MKNKMILQIEERYADMRASEQKAADYVMEHMEMIPDISLGKLASECKVSEPTVLRMVKALGYQGLRDFRNEVISALAVTKEEHQSPVLYGYSLNKEDKLEDIPRKVVTTTSKILEENLKNISIRTYEKVIKAIKDARMIDIYSVENSNVIAKDLLTKLLYLGFSCRHMDDTYHQRIAASNLTSEDVAIGISYSGCSEDTVKAMKSAKKSGATTIAVTNFKDAVISKYADLLICTSQNQQFYGDAIFSRASQIVLVDMIYMGLITSDYDRYAKCLDKSAKVIKDKAYQE
ncbi:MurPQ operon repressor [uncultured Eubacterium sp.]|nr:MurPQ operon repressor [uncultured Eubacterium sp.]